jgi:hypothetical protein
VRAIISLLRNPHSKRPLHAARRRAAVGRAGVTAICCLLLLGVSGCEDLNWPFHRARESSSSTAGDNGGGDIAAECADLRGQIKDNEEMRREAPTTTTDTDIVNAAQGKADKRIDDLRQRYDELDCPADSSGGSNRLPPLQPAPGGALPQG